MPYSSPEVWDAIYSVEDKNTRIALILLYRLVIDMIEADKIAEAVAEKVHRRRSFEWTIWQKLGAGLAGAIVIAESVKNLLGF